MGKAFFDDTANTAQTFVGFGGFVGEEDAWTRLQAEWLDHNELNGISEFHACDHPELIEEYTTLALEHEIHAVGYTIDLNAYREYATRRRRNPFGINEWASTAEGCMDLLLDWMFHFPEKDCALVFAKEDYRASIEDVWHHVKGRRTNGARLISCTATDDKKIFPLLQVADLAANLVCKYTDAKYYSGPANESAQALHDSRRSIKMMHFTDHNIDKLADHYTGSPLEDDPCADLSRLLKGNTKGQ